MFAHKARQTKSSHVHIIRAEQNIISSHTRIAPTTPILLEWMSNDAHHVQLKRGQALRYHASLSRAGKWIYVLRVR